MFVGPGWALVDSCASKKLFCASWQLARSFFWGRLQWVPFYHKYGGMNIVSFRKGLPITRGKSVHREPWLKGEIVGFDLSLWLTMHIGPYPKYFDPYLDPCFDPSNTSVYIFEALVQSQIRILKGILFLSWCLPWVADIGSATDSDLDQNQHIGNGSTVVVLCVWPLKHP